MAVTMAASEAEEIAKALNSLGIKKLTGKGVDPALRKALKQKNESVTNSKSNTDDTKGIREFFENIEQVQQSLKAVRDGASGEKYGRLSAANDIYDYINLVLEAENIADGSDAHEVSLEDNKLKIGKLSALHSTGVGYMSALRTLDSTIKVRVFANQGTKNYYDQYLKLEAQGFFKALDTIKILPKQLLTTVQVSGTLLTTIQNSMHITRQESVWVFNYLLGLSGEDQFVDMENEYAILICNSCDAINRLSPEQLTSMQKNKIPSCIACQERLLAVCPVCKKLMPKGAKKHICGWNVELKQRKDSFERAIQNANVAEAQLYFEMIDQMSTNPSETNEAKEKLDQLLQENKKEKKEIEQLIQKAEYDEAAKKLKEAESKYNDDPDIQAYKVVVNEAIKNRKRAETKAEIQKLIDENKLEEATAKLNEAESQGYDKELDIFRNRITQLRKIAQITAYTSGINRYLNENNLEQAEKTLESAEKIGLGTELNQYRKRIDEERERINREERQALQDFGDGHFGNYSNGIKKITRILDLCPSCQQAKIWLKDNPRREPVSKPTLQFKQGDNQCTISWEDDDGAVTYTVRRADGRYPRDPADGNGVCNAITNKRVTDTLPTNQPGVFWQYSIFAVRNLDGQWVKTECPEAAVWLPDPEGISLKTARNEKGYPVVHIDWDDLADGSAGVKIVRYSDEDGYKFPETIVDAAEKWDKAQTDCNFTDDDVERKTTYRYVFRQVWKRGTNKYMSSGVTMEITVE